MQKFVNAVGREIQLVTMSVDKPDFKKHYRHLAVNKIVAPQGAITVIGYESHDTYRFDDHAKKPTKDRRYNLIYMDYTEGGTGRTIDYTELLNCPAWLVGLSFTNMAQFNRLYGSMESNKDFLRYGEKIVAYHTPRLVECAETDIQLTRLQTYVFDDNFHKGRFIKNVIMVACASQNAVIQECGELVKRFDKMGRLDIVKDFIILLSNKINIKLFNDIA